MPLPGKEQESVTIVTYDGSMRRFTTTIPKDARYMMKRGLIPQVSKMDGEEVCWTFNLPDNWTYLPKPKKHVSEETRAKVAERMRKSDDNGDDDPE